MSNQRLHRQQKTREKQKKSRAQAQKRAAAHRVTGVSGDTMKGTETWPLGDCWVSGNWYEWEGQVDALFLRQHPSGAIAGAVFHVDLAERAVTHASVARDADVQQALIRLTESGDALESCPPEDLVRLVVEADPARHPAGWEEAMKLLQGVDPSKGTRTYRWGYENEEQDTDEAAKKVGLMDRVRGWFGARS